MVLPYVDPALLTNCTVDTCDYHTSFYNYRLSLAANATFLSLFSLLILVYLAIWAWTRRAHFFSVAMILGLVTEALGYGARIWSWYNQWNQSAFIMQFICIGLAPAFFSAAIYICMARIVVVFGKENSRIKPFTYTLIFIPCDIVALALQGIGGLIGAIGLTNLSIDEITKGDDILTAGLASQVFTMLCFLLLCTDLALRIRRRVSKFGAATALPQEPAAVAVRDSRMFHGMLLGLGLATLLIFWRCVYRLVELNDGWNGPVTFKQGLFIGFEGVLIISAASVLAVVHPAICMGQVLSKPAN